MVFFVLSLSEKYICYFRFMPFKAFSIQAHGIRVIGYFRQNVFDFFSIA